MCDKRRRSGAPPRLGVGGGRQEGGRRQGVCARTSVVSAANTGADARRAGTIFFTSTIGPCADMTGVRADTQVLAAGLTGVKAVAD